jgi:outer membrane receptor protein involved in Fe transport
MRIIRLYATFAIVAATAACASERTLAPQPSTPSFASSIASGAQVPLLFVVDGVRYQRDQVPVLSSAQVASVQVMKGHLALRQYGPDASYGVVIITTKQPSAPRS